jgi:hypothetical protein
MINIHHLSEEVKKKVSLFYGWILRHLWVSCIITAILSWLVTYFLLPISQGSNYADLLISISASLATIFALVFTGTTVLAQILKRGYKAMDTLLHNEKIIFVYFFFFAAIIYPLLVLKTDINLLSGLGVENSTVANLSLTTSIASMIFGIFVLIPYSLEIFKIAKYNAIPQLIQDAGDAIIENKQGAVKEVINELSYLGEDFIDHNYDYKVSFIINGLGDIGIKITEKEWVGPANNILFELTKIGEKVVENKLDGIRSELFGFIPNERFFSETKDILDALTEVGLRATDKKLIEGTVEFPIALHAIHGLQSIGLKAIDNNLSIYTIRFSPFGILRIGVKAAEKNLGMLGDPLGLLEEARNSLIEIGTKAHGNFFEITRSSMQYLWVLSAYVQKYHLADTEVWALKLKHKLEETTATVLFENEFQEAKKYLENIKQFQKLFPDIGDEIDNFESIYRAIQ